VKALILAGGFGTRLRPLTCTRPKLMFPVANRPLLDWVLEQLSRNGVTTVVLAVNYMADLLTRHFGKTKYGMRILYSRETKPLGTGGPIKKAEGLLDNGDEPFFVLNGDILSTIDYQALYKAHLDSGAKATIALRDVEDPSRFGVVDLDKSNRILRFVEKPKDEEAPSNLINAGVYVLDRSVLESIPGGREVSIEREVFPVLATRRELSGYRFGSLWVDIGTPNDYIVANKVMLDMIAPQNHFERGSRVSKRAKIIPPVAIARGVRVEADAVIGPYASLGEGTVVRRGSRVENSVLFPNAWIDCSASIRNAIVGEGAVIGSWVKIETDCIVGDHAVISDTVTLTSNVKVCPSKSVGESVLQPSIVM
jgi:mannose-1-phosphate guanylyltransferase